jgi:hypothetical protein
MRGATPSLHHPCSWHGALLGKGTLTFTFKGRETGNLHKILIVIGGDKVWRTFSDRQNYEVGLISPFSLITP